MGRHAGQDDDDRDGLRGAGCDAGGGFDCGEAAVARVALADAAQAATVCWTIIRAMQHTPLATDAWGIEVAGDAGERVLFAGENRAAAEAGGIGGATAGGGDRRGSTGGRGRADKEADVAPGFVVGKAVGGVAGGDAGFAAGAGIEFAVEGAVIAGSGLVQGN